MEDQKQPGMVYDKTPSMAGDESLTDDENSNQGGEGEQGQEMTYPKSDFLGTEKVQIDREVDSVFYPNMDAGSDFIRQKEAPEFVCQKLFDAADEGHFVRTLEHFEKLVMEKYSHGFEPGTLEELKGLFAEGKTTKDVKAFLGKFKEFANSLELEPIKKK